MIKIFLSWSGTRSRAMAEALTEWLPHVIQDVTPWFSQEHIKKGQNWNDALGKTLRSYQHGILCITPENYDSSWICFEAGALSKQLGNSRVCPVLLGIHSGDIDGPISQFQATATTRDDMLRMVKSLNELHRHVVPEKVIEASFRKSWTSLAKRLADIADMQLEGSTHKMKSVIKAFSKYADKEPEIGGHAYFKDGFESHALYDVVAKLADKRLYVLGRKNRKLFDKDHGTFFRALKTKIDRGFDFRILFLDPDSPKHLLRCEHRSSTFCDELRQSVERARSVMSDAGINTQKHARFYRAHRSIALVVIDDAALFTPIHLDDKGKAQALTKAPFTVLNSTSPHGAEMCQLFEELWTSGKPMK